MQSIVWSHSSYKMFTQCRRQYNLVKRLKVVKPKMMEANTYGVAAHKAFEEYFKHGTPLPEEFQKFQSWVDAAAALPGFKLIEAKLALNAQAKPTEFFAKDVWWRGVPDFTSINEEAGIAHLADWKFGKNAKYADKDQLELLAIAIFAKYPKIKKVKGMLAFLVSNEPVMASYKREDFGALFSKWVGRIAEIEAAEKNDTWNPTPGPLCNPWCPCTREHCEYKEA